MGSLEEPKGSNLLPLEVEKTIAGFDNYSLTNESKMITVELRCVKEFTGNIQVLEHIDPNFELINRSGIYVIGSIDDIIDYKNGRFNKLKSEHIDMPIDNKNDILYIINKLKLKERAVYYYYVKPRHHGTFKLDTLVRFEDIYPDLNIPLNVRVKDSPDFDVKVEINKLEALVDEKINITYRITYLGVSDSQYNCDVTLEYAKYYDVVDSQALFYQLNFSKNDPTRLLNIKLRYHNPGIYGLPVLSIGHQEYMVLGTTLTITSFIEKYGTTISAILLSYLSIYVTILRDYNQFMTQFIRFKLKIKMWLHWKSTNLLAPRKRYPRS